MAHYIEMKRRMSHVLPTTNVGHQRKEGIFNAITYLLLCLVVCSIVHLIWEFIHREYINQKEDDNIKFSLNLAEIEEFVLPADADESRPRNPNCRFWNCLNLYRCGQNGLDRLTVYVYPLRDFVDAPNGKQASTLSQEYYEMLETTVQSRYYTSNPNEACLFLVSIDLLNENRIDPKLVNRAFTSLDYWDEGKNHLIFNMMPGSYPTFRTTIDVNTDKALIMGGGFDTWSYRTDFDVSLPVWSNSLQEYLPKRAALDFNRKFKLIIAQLNLFPKHIRVLKALAQDNPSEILFLRHCTQIENTLSGDIRCNVGTRQHKHEYPHILGKGTFCFLGRSLRLGQPDLLEMLAFGCIPVIAIDNYVLPFEDVLDWSLFSIRIREYDLHSINEKLNSISHVKIMEMQEQGHWVFNRYFKDVRTIMLTTLEILENRVFPHRARSIKSWNTIDNNYRRALNPLFLPLIAPKSQGFTAVILTFDRVESLFSLIKKLAMVPSLHSIVVIWNNQRKLSPHLSAYPSITKPLKVIQTRANKLSNRFFPYPEIETEAILTIDDDIVMLTADELDFGYEVWREFPDRIVGFPSRIHVWDNTSMRWHYESEWTNQISMVLTGAAFHHKFWNHMYTYAMPGDIKDWVDEHMNCEDIAMNFLVANVTNKAPIKVTPRKKFKCPECTNTEMLSADLNHMRERSACIDRFARIYGRMPLRSVEFRADPVLFKDNFPEKLKRFNDVGIL